MSRALESMFVGSQIVWADRKLGFAYAQKTDLGPSDMSQQASQILLQAIRLAEGSWNLDPTPENLATIIIAEGIAKPESSEPEGVTAFKQSIIKRAIEFAELGANDTNAFGSIEAMLHVKKQEELLRKFGVETAPRIAGNPVGSPVDKGEAMLRELQEITSQWTPNSNIYGYDDQVREMDAYIAERREMIATRARLMNLPPELGRLGKLVPFIRKSLMYVIKGGTKSGKSSMMGQLSEWLARGHKVVYFALEDNLPRKIFQQTCRLVDGAVFEHLERGDFEGNVDKMMALRKSWEASGGSWILVHCPGKSAAWIVSVINRIQAQYGVDAVFVDYFQKISTTGQDRTRGLSEAGELLKQRAEEKGKEVAMFVGSQQTIDANGKSHTRESGDLEMKAQCVFSIQRKEAPADEAFGGVTLAHKGEQSVWTDLWVEYNNDGGTGKETVVNWKPRFMFTIPAFLKGTQAETYIPTLRKPSDKEIEEAWKTSQAYKSIGSSSMPF